jgi:hypothetical protein
MVAWISHSPWFCKFSTDWIFSQQGCQSSGLASDSRRKLSLIFHPFGTQTALSQPFGLAIIRGNIAWKEAAGGNPPLRKGGRLAVGGD